MRKRRFIIRKKGSALLRIGLILGIILVLGGAAYGIFALTGSQEQSQGLEQLPFTADTNYVFTGSGFLYMYGDRLTYDDLLDAKKDASYQVSTGSVQLAASPTLSVLYHETAVQILGAAESLTFTQQVEQVACGVSHVAVLLRGEGQAMSLQVYDKTGVQTDQMDFPDGELVNFGFAQTQDDTLWTLEMSPAGSLPLSTLTTYNLATNHTTGVMTIQGQLVDQVWFTQNSIFFSCTNNLIRFTRTGNTEAYRLLVYGWDLCDVSTAGSTRDLVSGAGRHRHHRHGKDLRPARRGYGQRYGERRAAARRHPGRLPGGGQALCLHQRYPVYLFLHRQADQRIRPAPHGGTGPEAFGDPSAAHQRQRLVCGAPAIGAAPFPGKSSEKEARL